MFTRGPPNWPRQFQLFANVPYNIYLNCFLTCFDEIHCVSVGNKHFKYDINDNFHTNDTILNYKVDAKKKETR